MNDLYFEINPKEKKILSPPQELDVNWKNISGILFLSKDELYDLSWSGYLDIGFVKIDKENIDLIKNLTYDDYIFNITKSKFNTIVSQNRYEKEIQTLLVDNKFSIQLSEKFKLNVLMKYNECIVNNNLSFHWKTIGGFVEFDSKKFLKLYKKIQEYAQSLFDLERDLYKKIEDCQDIISLIELDLSIDCDNKIEL